MIILRSFFGQREESVRNRVNGWREEREEINEERQGKKKKKRRYLGWIISSHRLSTIIEGSLQLIL